jgi:hypothetical protein
MKERKVLVNIEEMDRGRNISIAVNGFFKNALGNLLILPNKNQKISAYLLLILILASISSKANQPATKIEKVVKDPQR